VTIKEKDEAIQDTSRVTRANIFSLYTDASVTKRLASIAVVQRTGPRAQVVRQDSIGYASTCTVLSAEVAAIAAALKYAEEHRAQLRFQQLAIFSDSQQALRAISAGNAARSSRALLRSIAEYANTLIHAGVDLQFRWLPGHEGIIGNEEADEAAKEASSQVGKPTAPAQERVREIAGVIRLINRDRSEDPTPFDTSTLPGQYTWKMDQALPGKHTLQLYGSLTSEQASILIQARTGHCRLNQYLSRAGIVDEAKCECGGEEETIRHIILACPKWAEYRSVLREAADDRWGDVPYLLGGWGRRKDARTGQLLDGPKEKWKPNLEVVKATIGFLEKTGRLTFQQEAREAA
jgi:ribonuclease HI